jgi:hypothetical protein
MKENQKVTTGDYWVLLGLQYDCGYVRKETSARKPLAERRAKQS